MTAFTATVLQTGPALPATRLVVGGGPGEHAPVTINLSGAMPEFTSLDRYAYQFLDASDEQSRPILRLVAAPGVTVTVDRPLSLDPPDLDVYRVQDPGLVPPQGTDILSDLLLSVYEVNAPALVLEEQPTSTESPWHYAARLGHRPGNLPHNWFRVEVRESSTTIRHAASSQAVTIRVQPATYTSTETPGRDGTDAFTFEFPPDGRWGVSDQPLLRIAATATVRVTQSGPSYSDLRLLARDDVDPLLGLSWYQVWRVTRIAAVPPPGRSAAPRPGWIGPSLGQREPSITEELSRVTIDVTIGAIPVVGDLIDIGEFFYALATRRDRWGRRLDGFEIAVMGLFALVPFLSVAALRRGPELLRRFGRRSERVVTTLAALEQARLAPAELADLGEAQRLIRAGKALPVNLEGRLAQLLARLPLPRPTIESLLNEAGTAFNHSRLQELFQRYRAEGGKAGPAQWARVTRGEARKIFEGLLGKGYARRPPGEVRWKNLADVPRPERLTDKVLGAYLDRLRGSPDRVWERLGRLQALLRERPRQLGPALTQAIKFVQAIPLGLFWIMKGNIGEVLSFEKQLAVLVKLSEKYGPRTVLITGVRIRLANEKGKLGKSLLFSDNIIATMGSRDLTLRGLFEVKTGSQGVAESAEQIFRWIEDRLTPGSQIVLRRGSSIVQSDGTAVRLTQNYIFTWRPGESSTKPGERLIHDLSRGNRYLITPKDAVGELPESLATTSSRQLIRLDETAAELEYLTSQVAVLIRPPELVVP